MALLLMVVRRLWQWRRRRRRESKCVNVMVAAVADLM
jgi:hypothetical protein